MTSCTELLGTCSTNWKWSQSCACHGPDIEVAITIRYDRFGNSRSIHFQSAGKSSIEVYAIETMHLVRNASQLLGALDDGMQ